MLRVDTVWSGFGGGPFFTRLYFFGTTSQAADNARNNTVGFFTDIRDRVVNSVVMSVQPEIAVIDPSTGQPTGFFTDDLVNVTGNDSGDPAPWATQGLLQVSSGTVINGRRVRGRIFIGGVARTAAAASGGTGSPYRTLIQDAAENNLADSTWPLRIYSRTHGQEVPVTGFSVWNRWAVLRSRRD